MAVYSMTGYATAQSQPDSGAHPAGAGGLSIGVELRSVNGRFLDLSFRLPEALRACEPALRDLLGGGLRRGKVELRLTLESASNADLPVPSTRLLQRLAAVQEQIRSWIPDAAPLSCADAMRWADGERQSQGGLDDRALGLVRQALDDLLAARAREGARLVAAIRERLAGLRELMSKAGPLVPEIVRQQRQRFLERWTEALGQAEPGRAGDQAQERALAEAGAFAMRIDVAEELSRLAAHVEEIERLLKRGGEVGKRLDFLIQELHREANTLGSKSVAMAMTLIAVDMKVLIEQMREQVQNIE